MVQFIHRGIAYIFTILITIWYIQACRINTITLFSSARHIPLILVCCQVLLGIFTVLFSSYNDVFVWLGVAHQFIAMLLLMSLAYLAYIVRSSEAAGK